MEFEWDRQKAESNRRKQGVTFAEAITVFDDINAQTIDDPDHSQDETRWITLGRSKLTQIETIERESSRRARQLRPNGKSMKKSRNEFQDELRAEYEAELFKNAVRGKYFAAYRRGTNVVILDSDVARAFPTEKAVNDALRRLIPKKASPPAKARRKRQVGRAAG
jgi:uncharacterized DUF497 family protein